MAAVNFHAVSALIVLLLRRRRRRPTRNVWSKQWILRREEQGVFQNLQRELVLEDRESFRRFLRISPESFDSLVQILGASIRKNNTFMRKAITVEEKVSMTLRFLATGETFRDLSYLYRAGERTISEAIKQTTQAIYSVMKDSYLKTPSTASEWQEVARQFEDKWNYPFCLGAIDGKHIAIRQPPNSGSQYFNYKHFYSVILMALVGADYRFLYVDAGAAGRCGDVGVFNQSSLKKCMDLKTLNFPKEGNLPGDDNVCHYHIIGDDAFPLGNDIMKPFSHRSLEHSVKIFNYRLSRARRVVENAFGILANRFRVFLTTISLDPEHVDYIILAACILHNFLIVNQSSYYTPPSYTDHEDESHRLVGGQWRSEQNTLTDVESTRSRNASHEAKRQRESLKSYFISTGAVSWQNEMVA